MKFELINKETGLTLTEHVKHHKVRYHGVLPGQFFETDLSERKICDVLFADGRVGCEDQSAIYDDTVLFVFVTDDWDVRFM